MLLVQEADDKDADDDAGDKRQHRDPPARSSLGRHSRIIGWVFRIGASHVAPPRMERLVDLRS